MTTRISLRNRRCLVIPLLAAYVCLLALTAAPHAHPLSTPRISGTSGGHAAALAVCVGEHHADSCPLCVWSATAGFALTQEALTLTRQAAVTAFAAPGARWSSVLSHNALQTRAPPALSL